MPRSPMDAGKRVPERDTADADERPVLVATRVAEGRILLIRRGAGLDVRGVRRRPVVRDEVVVATLHRALAHAELVVRHEIDPGDRHDREVESLPVEPARHARRPGGERRPEDDAVVTVDLAVAVHVGDADLSGLRFVLLGQERVLRLPDSHELVVVVHVDGLPDDVYYYN